MEEGQPGAALAAGPGGGSEPGAPAAAEAPAGEAPVDVAPLAPAPASAAPEEPPPPSTAGTEASSAPGLDGPHW